MQRIEAHIAGRIIPLKVTEEEEVFVRKAIEEVNARIQRYQLEFTQKDAQDCVLMALLTYAVDYHKAHDRLVDDSALDSLLNIRDQLLVLETESED